MELSKIKELLEKYYEGLTTLQEEQELRVYFSTNEVPQELRADSEWFLYAVKTESLDVTASFEGKLSDWMDRQPSDEEKYRKHFMWVSLSGIAAGIAILLISYFAFFRSAKEYELKDTYNNPQIAYTEAKRTLLYVSQQLNRGTAPLSHIAKINQGMDELSTFSSLGESLESLELISKYYRESMANDHKKINIQSE